MRPCARKGDADEAEWLILFQFRWELSALPTAKRSNTKAQGRAAHPGMPVPDSSHTAKRCNKKCNRFAVVSHHFVVLAVSCGFPTQGALRDPGLWGQTPSALDVRCVRSYPRACLADLEQ